GRVVLAFRIRVLRKPRWPLQRRFVQVKGYRSKGLLMAVSNTYCVLVGGAAVAIDSLSAHHFAYGTTHYFPDRGLRQLVDKMYSGDFLYRSDVLPGPCNELFFGDVGITSHYHRGYRCFAPLRMRLAHDSCLGNRGMIGQSVF